MQRKHHDMWVEQYRPQTINDYIFHRVEDRSLIEQFISDKKFPHLILSGIQGTGKTTLANILIAACGVQDADILELNASSQRGIAVVREEIESFVGAMPFGDFKVVYLEEADKLTLDAQDSLKSTMEKYSDSVRFIFTCNSPHKIVPALRSRCQELHFKYVDANDMALVLSKILAAEHVSFKLETVDEYVRQYSPDIRKMINEAQKNSTTGTLRTPNAAAGAYEADLMEALAAGSWKTARSVMQQNSSSDEWEKVYTFLYKNIHEIPKFKDKAKWEAAILVIAERLYRHAFVADPEINGTAMFIELENI